MFTLPENPYAVLDVAKNAQIPEIRLAYRKLVLKCHPDKVTDPAQKAIKAEEFQKVQKAYEVLSDETERQKYDDMVRANELEKDIMESRRQRDRGATPGRTPPRSYDSDYAKSPHYTVHVKPETPYKTRTAEPPQFKKSQTWAAPSSPYASTRTPPRSFEEVNQYSSYADPRDSRDSRRSKKASYPDEKVSSRHEEDRRSRKKNDEDYERMQEKLEKSRRKEEAALAAAAAAKETEKLRKAEEKRRKEERRKPEKVRDSERKRDIEEKRSRHKPAFVEDDSDPLYSTPSKEKKSKSSSRSKEVPIPVHVREVRGEPRDPRQAEEIDKLDDTLQYARQYLETSTGKPPSLQRSKTYAYQPPPVATPPPAHGGVAPPPPMPNIGARIYSEEDDEPVPRSSARRRMSNESPRVRMDKTSSSYKKSSREPEYVAESARPMPKMYRSQTEYRPVSGVSPGLSRTTTWAGDDGRGRQADYFTEESEDDSRQQRRTRRTRSPDEAANTFTYKVKNGQTQAQPRAVYADDHATSRKYGRSSYYAPEANMGRPLDQRPAMPTHSSYSGQHFGKVKTSKMFDASDITYSPHAAQAYGPREQPYGVA
ncbi:hypothetical protein KJ359_007326 [Pestalotiopsis sp. 9143b]|nr:hypothetical protein KJ359_007326 [Pestalotiopsis sp. 9143b]